MGCSMLVSVCVECIRFNLKKKRVEMCNSGLNDM